MSYILHICSWFPNEEDPQNGVFIRQHIELTQDSFLPVVICNTPKNTKQIAPKTFEVFNLHSSASKWSKIKTAKQIFKTLLVEKGRPQAIHLHVASPLGIIALLASRFFNVRLILTEHWTGYRSGLFLKASPLQKIITKMVFKKADTVLVVSESLQHDILSLNLTKKENIRVVPNPITLSNQGVLSVPLRQNGVNMLSVADFNEKNKNFTGILTAFERVLSSNPNLHWTIIGDGPDKLQFEALLDNSSAKNRVRLLGRKNQAFVHQHYSEFDFLVSFSRFETFAMVPAEAILAGIPVIASASGGPEYYVNHNNGILVESDNINELENAIKTLSTTFSSYTSAQLNQSLPKNFSPSHFTATLLKLYHKE